MAWIVLKKCTSDIPEATELSVETALFNWRRKAVDIFMACLTLIYFPGIVLLFYGHGPPLAWPVTFLVVTSYLVIVLSAIFRSVDHRLRVCAMLGIAYLTGIAGVVA